LLMADATTHSLIGFPQGEHLWISFYILVNSNLEGSKSTYRPSPQHNEIWNLHILFFSLVGRQLRRVPNDRINRVRDNHFYYN